MAQSPVASLIFSVRGARVVIAAAGAVLAAVAGAYANDYLSRAKPSLSVTSIGFGGAAQDQTVTLSSELIDEASDISGIPDIHTFESFGRLMDEDKLTSEYIQKINRSIRLINDTTNNIDLYSSTRLSDNPLITDDLATDIAIVLFKTGLMQNDHPPISLDALQKVPQKLFLSEGHDDSNNMVVWRIFAKNRSRILKMQDGSPDYTKSGFETFAFAICTGNKDDIRFFLDKINAELEHQLNLAQTFQSELRDTALPKATFVVNISIFNAGQRAVTLQPYLNVRPETC